MNLDDLKRVCQEATPGRWGWTQRGLPTDEDMMEAELTPTPWPDREPHDLYAGNKCIICTGGGEYTTPSIGTARFIATFNPSRVAKLLALAVVGEEIEERAWEGAETEVCFPRDLLSRLSEALAALNAE